MEDKRECIRYLDQTSPIIMKLLNNNSLVLPVGTIEQHGPHLPLSVDIDITVDICKKLCFKKSWVMGPKIIYAARSLPQSGGGGDFPGTISISGKVLIDYFTDIISSFCRMGLKNLYIINGHYENEAFIFEAIEICRQRNLLKGMNIVALSWWSAIDNKFIKKKFNDTFVGWHAEHAGFVETSLMLYLRPEKVKFINEECSNIPMAGVYYYSDEKRDENANGVLSSSIGATSKEGKEFFDHICKRLEIILV